MGMIEELLKDKYKLRIPPTVYYDLLADVVEIEEQEPKTGHWIDTKEISISVKGHILHEVICSECSGISFFRAMGNKYIGANICPNCGARMVEPQESEETETWNGIHAQITAPKGTFERIFNDTDDDNDI